eukprot:TRINITY_DN41240_c0_g1_i1.p1 TRINITY_DN41240_c0_g1~~TRINITY_DN41240_c0_g1_i1.p1  ORF type:complete len:183 (-),score=21.36 TRINITY_DN41240_c0_g1_i1:248-796(-)
MFPCCSERKEETHTMADDATRKYVGDDEIPIVSARTTAGSDIATGLSDNIAEKRESLSPVPVLFSEDSTPDFEYVHDAESDPIMGQYEVELLMDKTRSTIGLDLEQPKLIVTKICSGGLAEKYNHRVDSRWRIASGDMLLSCNGSSHADIIKTIQAAYADYTPGAKMRLTFRRDACPEPPTA